MSQTNTHTLLSLLFEVLLMVPEYLHESPFGLQSSLQSQRHAISRPAEEEIKVLAWRGPFTKEPVPYDQPHAYAGSGYQYRLRPRSELVEACRVGDIHTAKNLLDNGATPSPAPRLFDEHRWLTPLVPTTRVNNREAVELLLDAGADFHANPGHYTNDIVRLLCCEETDEEIIALLVGHGNRMSIDWNKEESSQFSSLTWDVKSSVKFTKLLLEAGANANEVDDQGRTLSFRAMSFEYPRSRRLPSSFEPDYRNRSGKITYGKRLKGGKKAEICRLLLEYGATYLGGHGIPWHRLLEQGLGEVLRVFTESGLVSVDEVDVGECSMLLHAVEMNHCSAVKTLLNSGADAFKSDKKGRTPFIFAKTA
ncbi:ankyrin repeat-containing domain protein [Aspergillus oleicola]